MLTTLCKYLNNYFIHDRSAFHFGEWAFQPEYGYVNNDKTTLFNRDLLPAAIINLHGYLSESKTLAPNGVSLFEVAIPFTRAYVFAISPIIGFSRTVNGNELHNVVIDYATATVLRSQGEVHIEGLWKNTTSNSITINPTDILHFVVAAIQYDEPLNP